MSFNGCKITRADDGSIKMSMEEYVKNVSSIPMTRGRWKQQGERASAEEYEKYRSLAWTVIWAGHGALPQAAFVGSYIPGGSLDLQVKLIT